MMSYLLLFGVLVHSASAEERNIFPALNDYGEMAMTFIGNDDAGLVSEVMMKFIIRIYRR